MFTFMAKGVNYIVKHGVALIALDIHFHYDRLGRNSGEYVVIAQPQPQPNSTSTRVGVDKVISWTTTTTPPTPHKLLRHFQTT